VRKTLCEGLKLGYSCRGLCYVHMRAWLCVEEALSVPFCWDLRCGVSCGQLGISYKFTPTGNTGVSWKLIGH